MSFRGILSFILVFLSTGLYAQRLHTVSGSFTYYLSQDISVDQAKRQAVEKAKIQLIADEFGTIVGSSSVTFVNNTSSSSEVSMISLGESEVKGEWIETIGEPEISLSFENAMIVISVAIKGKVREIKGSKIELDVKVLKNGTEPKYESADFRDGDDMFLYFRSPVDGYLTVYLYDGMGQVYCLLPYSQQNAGRVDIKAGRPYVFFDVESTCEEIPQYIVDEYCLTCSQTMELNRIYAVFSPQVFTRALDDSASEALPRSLDFEAFQKWLAKCRRQDPEMIVSCRDISIKK